LISVEAVRGEDRNLSQPEQSQREQSQREPISDWHSDQAEQDRQCYRDDEVER
jgi:hypothetical protein